MKLLKPIAIAVLISLVCVNALLASVTRRDNLGFSTDMYLLDNSNIWTFPSTIVLFSQQVNFESMPNDQLYRGGINLKLSPTIVGGVYLTNDTYEVKYANTNLTSRTAAHYADIFMGIQGNSVAFGAHISHYTTKNTLDDLTNANLDAKTSQSFIGITLGLSIFNGTQGQFDGAINVGWARFNNEPAPNPPHDGEGNLNAGVGLRYIYSVSNQAAIVPFAGFMVEGSGYATVINNKTNSTVSKSNSFIIGIAHQYVPTQQALVLLAIGYVRTSSSSDVVVAGQNVDTPANSWHALPFISLGLESKLYKWLSARFGIYELLQKSATETPATSKLSSTSSSYTPYFGLAFHLKRFTLDAIVNQDFLHNGPYMLSGNPYNNLFSQLSITYAIP